FHRQQSNSSKHVFVASLASAPTPTLHPRLPPPGWGAAIVTAIIARRAATHAGSDSHLGVSHRGKLLPWLIAGVLSDGLHDTLMKRALAGAPRDHDRIADVWRPAEA